MFKTLVARGDRTGIVVACIPVAAELDLKALARVSGNKSAELLPLKELLPTTGYVRGGCSPVGMKKRFPTFIDDSAEPLPRIAVSAGARGVQFFLKPADLSGAVSSIFAPLTLK